MEISGQVQEKGGMAETLTGSVQEGKEGSPGFCLCSWVDGNAERKRVCGTDGAFSSIHTECVRPLRQASCDFC